MDVILMVEFQLPSYRLALAFIRSIGFHYNG